jgi:hypothetical protein
MITGNPHESGQPDPQVFPTIIHWTKYSTKPILGHKSGHPDLRTSPVMNTKAEHLRSPVHFLWIIMGKTHESGQPDLQVFSMIIHWKRYSTKPVLGHELTHGFKDWPKDQLQLVFCRQLN